MRIGIIGVGKIGGLLAAKLALAGHSVAIANSRGPDTLAEMADQIGATATDLSSVGRAADIVVLSIPFSSISVLDPAVLPVGTPVVDTTNYVPVYRDPPIAVLDAGGVESVWTQQRLQRQIVKAFNTINVPSLRDLGRSAGAPDRIALSVAADNAYGKRLVSQLVNDTGYDPVDGGSLPQSWRQQPGTPAFCTNLGAVAVREALDAARADQTAQWRTRMAARAAESGSIVTPG